MTLKSFNGRWIARYPGQFVCAAIAPWSRQHRARLLHKTNDDGYRYLFTLDGVRNLASQGR